MPVPRGALVTILGTDAEMITLGFSEDQIYGSNSPDSPSRSGPFIVIKVEDEPKAFGGVGPAVIAIWVHFPREMGNDFTPIDATMERIRELLLAAEQVPGGDGVTLTSASWQGDSPDMSDDGYRTNVRFSRWRVSGRAAVVP